MNRWLLCLIAGASFALPCWSDRAELVGTLWWVSPDQAAWSRADWGKEFDALQALGMNTMVLNGPYIGQELKPEQSDPSLPLFEEADHRGIRLYLDTLSAPEWWTSEDGAGETARAKKRVSDLQTRYGKYPSFHGFYIPYELYVMWDQKADLIRNLYREVATACKAADPKKPVMISPFFILDQDGYLGSFRWATPVEYEQFWKSVLEQAPIDIVALQDSGEHLSFYSMDDRRPFFAAMQTACTATAKTLWANVETAELEISSFDAYAAQFGRKTHVNDPKLAAHWRPVSEDKLIQKLTLAGEFTPVAITWGYQSFIRSPGHAQLYELYRQRLVTK